MTTRRGTGTRPAGPAPIERAGSGDLAMLAMQTPGDVPEQLGAVLLLDGGADGAADVDRLSRLAAERLGSVLRLRQRLHRPPPGCGRPVWVEVPDFDPAGHVGHRSCPSPADEQGLLDLAVDLVTSPLAQDRPLWSATVVSGLAHGRLGLVVVLHHVIADGLGGLSLLAGLVDGAALPAAPLPAGPPPTAGRLAVDSLRSKTAAVRRLPGIVRDLRRATTAAGGLSARPAADCSLLARTGPRRRAGTATCDLAAVKAAAHHHGGTVNDAVLAGVGGALAALLAGRGEQVDEFRVAVMVSARPDAAAMRLGNSVVPLVVGVPATGPAERRLAQTVGAVRAARTQATGPNLPALLGPLFRMAARLGLYRWFMRHQRRIHALLSNLRGIDVPMSVAGRRVIAVTPLAVGQSGNVTVGFLVLSYAGTLSVTVMADPDRVPELAALTAGLQSELDVLTAAAG